MAETALRRELGDDAAKAGWWIFAARNALQAMDEAEAGRFCFCRSVWHCVQNRALLASHPLPARPIGRGWLTLGAAPSILLRWSSLLGAVLAVSWHTGLALQGEAGRGAAVVAIVVELETPTLPGRPTCGEGV